MSAPNKGKRAPRPKASTPPPGKTPLSASLRQVLDSRDRLRLVESRIDQECLQIVQELGEERLHDLLEETYTLATQHADLRFADLSAAHAEIDEIMRVWRGEEVASRDLEDLMADAVRKIFSDSQRRRLKRVLYSKLATAKTEEEMRLWALAAASLELFDPGVNPFLLGTFQTSLIEILNYASEDRLDLSRPATPVDREVEALVGRELAEAAARTPHLFIFLDRDEVLFTPAEMEEHALRFFDWAQTAERQGRSHAVKQERDRLVGEILEQLLTPERRQELTSHLQNLRQRSERGELPAEVANLASVTVELFDRLPPGLHPFLQALWLASVERLLEEI